MDAVTELVFMIAGLLALGAAGEFIFNRTGIPDMIWLVLAGIVAGPVLHIVEPGLLEPVLPFFGAVALISILAGGGIRLRIAEVRTAAPRAFMLAILGFLTTIAAFILFAEIAIALGYIQPASLAVKIMVGAILGGTSSLVIIPAMSNGTVKNSVARLLELESCITDALCVVIAMMMINLVIRGSFSIETPVGALAQAVGIGVTIGAAGAISLLPVVKALRRQPHYYTMILAGFFVIYGAAQYLGGNGALSVLIAALILGNAPELLGKLLARWIDRDALQHDRAALNIHDHVTFFIKTFFFFLIGLMFPTSPRMILIGAAFALLMMLFRVPTAFLALRGAGFTLRDMSLISVAIPRGMAAGVLSALPVYYGVPGMERLAEGVFAAIVFSILYFTIGFAILKNLADRPVAAPATAIAATIADAAMDKPAVAEQDS